MRSQRHFSLSFLADRTSRSTIGDWNDNVVCLSVCPSVCLWRYELWLYDTSYSNTILQLLQLHRT